MTTTGATADARYDLPGPHVQLNESDGWYDEPWWGLNHGYYGVTTPTGHARWVIEALDGIPGLDGDATSTGYRDALTQVDQHSSAISHVVAHHGGCDGTGIRLRIDARAGEFVVSSFDSFDQLGVIHADGSFTVQAQPVAHRVEPYTGLTYR